MNAFPFEGNRKGEKSHKMKKETVLKSGKKLQIVEARKEDAKQLIVYVKQIADESRFLTFSSNEFLMTVEQEETFIENMNKQENNLLLVAKIDNEIIGMITLASSKRARIKHSAELAMSVKKEYWNKGVGSALMENCIKNSKENNITTKINLNVSVNNQNAIKLYKKFNFEIEGERKNHFKIGDDYVNSFYMGLNII